MSIVFKDKKRMLSLQYDKDNKEIWNISLKYSTILMNNKSKLDTIFSSVYGEYINELKMKKLNHNNKNLKHIMIWETLSNNLKKIHNDHMLSLQILHLTNIYRG